MISGFTVSSLRTEEAEDGWKYLEVENPLFQGEKPTELRVRLIFDGVRYGHRPVMETDSGSLSLSDDGYARRDLVIDHTRLHADQPEEGTVVGTLCYNGETLRIGISSRFPRGNNQWPLGNNGETPQDLVFNGYVSRFDVVEKSG